jgi:hypothetical protein
VSVFHSQSAEDEAQYAVDRIEDFAGDVRYDEVMHYTERMLTTIQLSTAHDFPEFHDVKIETRFGLSRGSQYEPDQTLVRYFWDADVGAYKFTPDPLDAGTGAGTSGQNVFRGWRHIEEWQTEAELDVTVPFDTWVRKDDEIEQGFIKFGPSWERSERDFDQANYGLDVGELAQLLDSVAINGYGADRLSFLFLDGRDQLIRNNRIGVNDNAVFGGSSVTALEYYYTQLGSTSTDYIANQEIDAFYGMVELPITPEFKVTTGARVESTKLSLNLSPGAGFNTTQFAVAVPPGTPGINPLRPDGTGLFLVGNLDPALFPDAVSPDIDQVDFLPAVNMSYEMADNMFIKAAWSETIARPTFREISPVVQFTSLGEDAFVGNANLVISKAQNYDARWEWFPNPGDVFSASVFYKIIEDPIQFAQITSTSGTNYIFPDNFGTGTLYGFEVEARKNLGFFGEFMSYFTLGANFTVIESKTRLPDITARTLAVNFGYHRDEVPLQGRLNIWLITI